MKLPDMESLRRELEQDKLASQWPKKCGCGRVYVQSIMSRDPEQIPWLSLLHAYNRTDAFASFEARHCSCGSTLEVMTEIHDLNEE